MGRPKIPRSERLNRIITFRINTSDKEFMDVLGTPPREIILKELNKRRKRK